MTTEFHTWSYGRFIEIQRNLRRKKLRRTSQGSNNLEGSFSNRDNVKAPIEFRRESQPQHLQTSSCPSPQYLVGQIQVQKLILVVATDQMPDYI